MLVYYKDVTNKIRALLLQVQNLPSLRFLEKEKVIFKYVSLKLKLKNPKLNLSKRGKIKFLINEILLINNCVT